MSRIHKEHLQAGYIFGDPHNSEYLYLPAGEVGSSDPRCIFEQGPNPRRSVPNHRPIYIKTV